MLYFKPNLVLPKDQWGEGKEKKNKIKAFNEGWAWVERKWPVISADTGVGNPMLATREKGEKYFKAVCKKIGGLIYDLAVTDIDKLYE